MLTANEKLDALTDLGVKLNRVADLDILMERILTEARRFVNANAGSIYIREDDRLHFKYTQNAELQARLSPGAKLIYGLFSIPVNDESIAGFAARNAVAVNVPDVYLIGSDKPYKFSPRFDRTSGYHTKSMLTIPLMTHRGDAIGVLQIINAQDESGRIRVFSDEDETLMAHFAGTAAVALERARMTRAIILRMIRMAEFRDPKETGAHVNRVGAYSVEIYEAWARREGTPEKEIETNRDVLRMSAMMHDVGKVAISDTILKKPAGFTPEEFEVMQQHAVIGARLFAERQSEYDEAAAIVALNHHERWNGKGYPGHINVADGRPLHGLVGPDGRALGKKGEEIPLYGRIVAIADVYDALCSRRVYKPAWTEQETLKVLEDESGKHFDPRLIETFFSCLDNIRAIRKRYPDENEDLGQQDSRKISNNI